METSIKESTQAVNLIPVSLESTPQNTRPVNPAITSVRLALPTGNNESVSLSDGYTTSKAFYDHIGKQVASTLPTLKRNRKYKSNSLCGKDYWESLDNADRRIGGRCIAHMVVNRKLPLVLVKGKHEYPKWYFIQENT